jgi:thiosulfate/3-mercaptopyruvate sulfurtransferase
VPVSEALGSNAPIVSATWLHDHLDQVRVVDVRWYLDGRSGLAAYRAGHLPGAVWADLDSDLAAPPAGLLGRHPLPSPEHFAAALGRLGISHDDAVVVYDDASGSIAGRLWWMLDAIGVAVAVLDGGIHQWTWPLSLEDVSPEPVEFAARGWPVERFVDADAVDRIRRDDSGISLIDARAFARFTGEEASIDARPGHVPGARSAPWTENVDPDSGLLLPAAELRDRFAALGIGDGARVVATCGSGVTACHDLLALRVAGIDDGALYTGSWSGWSSDPARPVAVGEE